MSLLLILASWICFGLIALHSNFGDELENFTAAWLVNQGLVPYKDFFFHHAPGPYFWAAPLSWLRSDPWQYFRYLILIWFGVCSLTSWLLVDKRLQMSAALVWLCVAISAPFWQIHMFLAESLMTLAITTTFVVLYSWYRYKTPHQKWVWLVWIIGGWVAIWSSIVAIPSILWLGLALILISAQRAGLLQRSSPTQKVKLLQNQFLHNKQTILVYGLLFLVLHCGFLGYFLFHHALSQAWWSVVTYNFQFYFPLRLAGTNAGAQLGYFPSTLIDFGEYLSKNIQTILTSSSIFGQTTLGILKNIFAQPASLPNLFGVALSAWTEKMFTVHVFGFFGLLIPALFCIFQKKWVALLWWIVFCILLLTRTNELFKLAPYFICTCSVTLLVLSSQRGSRKTIFVGGWTLIWLSLVIPSYKAALTTPVLLIPHSPTAVAQKITQELENYQGSIFNLGGNPVYYVLTQRKPAYVYFYYHPWFHGTPQMREGVLTFISDNKTSPILIEAEADPHASIEYAPEITNLIREKYQKKGGVLYWPKEQ